VRLDSRSHASGALALIGCLFASAAISAAGSSVDEELLAAQRSLISANNRADLDTINQLTADEWIGVNASGVLRTKAELPEEIAKRGPAKVQATPEQLSERQKAWKVRAYDNAGVVTRLTAGDHGSRSWISTVWIRRDGRWQRILSQETTAAAAQR
jgi:hypothetical protein